MTLIWNTGSEALALPSETLITMLVVVPAFEGVPEIAPLCALNVAQAGKPVAVKFNASRSLSSASGSKK
jgi:hypothetical protein